MPDFSSSHPGPIEDANELSICAPFAGSINTIRISAVGGGTVGRCYSDQYWHYTIWTSDPKADPIVGSDLHISLPATHLDAINELVDFLGLDFPDVSR